MSRRGRGASSSQQRTGEHQRRGSNARTPSVRAETAVRATTPRQHQQEARAASTRRQQQGAAGQAARRRQRHEAEADAEQNEVVPDRFEGAGAEQNEDVPDRFEGAAQQLPEDLRQFARTLRTTVVEESGRVSWTDIQGLHSAKNSLIFAAHLPLVRPEFFVGARRRTKGILLFGPPGTGKTLLARALLNDRPEMTFFNVTSATLTATLLGESEKIVKALFHLAKNLSPSIVFFDAIDALCGHRGGHTEHEASRRIKSELLMNMDGISTHRNSNVIVLTATNFPWDFLIDFVTCSVYACNLHFILYLFTSSTNAFDTLKTFCTGASVYLPHKLSSVGKIRDTHMQIQKRNCHYMDPLYFEGILNIIGGCS